MTNVNDVLQSLFSNRDGMFTQVTFNSKLLKFTFKDNEYTPLIINVVDNEDVTNLNILLNYIMNGAKVSSKMNEDPEVDVEYEVDMLDDEHIYKFDLEDFSNPDQETEGYDDLEKDPLVAPYLNRILEHAAFVYNFTNTHTTDAYYNESLMNLLKLFHKYSNHLEVKYELNYDTGSYDIIIKTSK